MFNEDERLKENRMEDRLEALISGLASLIVLAGVHASVWPVFFGPMI